METVTDPCAVCGGTDSKLMDGFYYCIECGTQNTNVRETIIEDKALANGTFAQKNKRKIIHIEKDGIEMSGEWYKWHAFNFIMSGLADELVSLGAKPSFKLKLLWIWTRYVKKYQNKEELLINKTGEDNDMTALATFMVEEDSNAPEELQRYTNKRKYKNDIQDGSKRDIKALSIGVIIAMLYVALNLDKSDIQLSHLYRFIQEKHLDLTNLCRYVPDDIKVKKIQQWTSFLRSKLCNQHLIRALAMSLLNKLDLGTPIVPDLKTITENFLTELCLPYDLKPFIYSLMHSRKCHFLDIDNTAIKYMCRIPDYEGTVMSHILFALKICFGLDGDYEVKVSEAVGRINIEADLPRSYRLGQYSDPSDRLFSFKQWCSYLQFREVMLGKYNLRMAERNCLEVDDYVYLEQMEERSKRNELLSDKISMEIMDRLEDEQTVGVIPKQLFTPSLTPMSDYTNVIINHCQDIEIKEQLAEDFRRYSIKYACENFDLIDSNIDNMIKGVSIDGKTQSKVLVGKIVTNKTKTNMVYVKNCENRNWMKTNPPTIEHLTCVETENNDKDSDHGYDSENTSKEKEPDTVIEKDITDLSLLDVNSQAKDASIIEDTKQEIIEEEHADINIFDDSFEDIDHKEQCERNASRLANGEEDGDRNEDDNHDFQNEDFDRRSDVSDDISHPIFNPDTFDRERTIKELILLACKKHKIPIPTEYKPKEPRKRKIKPCGEEPGTSAKRTKRSQHEGKVTVQELISNYYSLLETDFVNKVQREMSLAVRTSILETQNQEAFTNLEIIDRNPAIESGSLCNGTLGTAEKDEDDINVTNIPDINDRTLEDNLFAEDEVMKLEDFIQKGDPQYDERKYDIDQLYIRVKDEQEDLLLDIKQDPAIYKILDTKIEQCGNIKELEKLKAIPQIQVHVKEKEDSDSEDDIPLSVLQEEKKFAEKTYNEEENYEPLITKEISEYKYWIRHYDQEFMRRSVDLHTKFDEELRENTPASFYFVIEQCASVLNCTKFYLYKHLQMLEQYHVNKMKGSESRCSNF